MKFTQYVAIIESKANSIQELKNLVVELEKELKFREGKNTGESEESRKEKVRKRYARIANRTLKDLIFSVDDFLPDVET